MTIFLVLGYEHAPVITWSYNREFALDQARIHRGAVVALPVLADFELQQPPAPRDARTAAWAPYGMEPPTGEPEPPAPMLTRPYVAPPPPPPADDPSGSVEGWAIGGRTTDQPRGWEYEREQAADVVAQARRSAGPQAAAVIADAYRTLGVEVPVEAVDALHAAGAQRPTIPTLEAIRDGLKAPDDPTVQLDRHTLELRDGNNTSFPLPIKQHRMKNFPPFNPEGGRRE